jgi:hypothetical protein
MGIGNGDLARLISLTRDGFVRPGGAVVELGAQQLNKSFFYDQTLIDEIGQLFGARDPFPLKAGEHGNDHLDLDPTDPLARDFWRWLGFDYLAIDIDGSPQSLPLDLNYDEVPQIERKRFSLVTNFGTTEHICNQLNAFKVVHDLCALNGLMLHVLPAQGYFNHGLVNYNPKFFWMLARSNRYRWLHVDYHRGIAQPLPQNIIDNVKHYSPEILERSMGYVAEDCGLVIVLQKSFDIPFVAPIDVNTGTKAPNRILEQRYWTVFRPDAIDANQSSGFHWRPSRIFEWANRRRNSM